jgi:hypothetical protein
MNGVWLSGKIGSYVVVHAGDDSMSPDLMIYTYQHRQRALGRDGALYCSISTDKEAKCNLPMTTSILMSMPR